MNIAILLFEHVDLLDSGGPYEVFLTASRLAERAGNKPPFEVMTVSPDGQPVTAYGGLGLIPGGTLVDVPSPGVLIVPGTIDIDAAVADAALVEAIAKTSNRMLRSESSLVCSVCTGAFLLAAAGLLDGHPWTTHWEDIDALGETLGSDHAMRDVRWVDSGQIVTAAGLSSGIDMALHLVDRLAGRDLASLTARQIDHVWNPQGAYD